MTTGEQILSIGVVLYRTDARQLELLVRSVEAARRHPGAPAAAVAFFDNSETDALHAGLQGFDYRHSPRNVGFGAAQNVLMRAAFDRPQTQAHLCLNPDAVLHPACLAHLWAEAGRHPGHGLIEARQFPDEHAKPWEASTHETPWCSGCCLLISRAAHERLGGFDEQFFLYAEDVDLSWRARAAGLHVGIAPDALVHHYVGDRAASHASNEQIARSGALLAAKVRADPALHEVATLDAEHRYASFRW